MYIYIYIYIYTSSCPGSSGPHAHHSSYIYMCMCVCIYIYDYISVYCFRRSWEYFHPVMLLVWVVPFFSTHLTVPTSQLSFPLKSYIFPGLPIVTRVTGGSILVDEGKTGKERTPQLGLKKYKRKWEKYAARVR